MTKHGLPVEERFWAKVDVRGPDDCWLWIAGRMEEGYGRFKIHGEGNFLAHRLAWTFIYGDPGELCVLHHCDNPPCVNPMHLYLGTRADNNADKAIAGRSHRLAGEANGRAKLTMAQVVDVRSRYMGERGQKAAFAREFGVSKTHIGYILNDRVWS